MIWSRSRILGWVVEAMVGGVAVDLGVTLVGRYRNNLMAELTRNSETPAQKRQPGLRQLG